MVREGAGRARERLIRELSSEMVCRRAVNARSARSFASVSRTETVSRLASLCRKRRSLTRSRFCALKESAALRRWSQVRRPATASARRMPPRRRDPPASCPRREPGSAGPRGVESVGDASERRVWIFGEAAHRVALRPEPPGRELGNVGRAVRVETSARGRSRAFEARSIVGPRPIVRVGRWSCPVPVTTGFAGARARRARRVSAVSSRERETREEFLVRDGDERADVAERGRRVGRREARVDVLLQRNRERGGLPFRSFRTTGPFAPTNDADAHHACVAGGHRSHRHLAHVVSGIRRRFVSDEPRPRAVRRLGDVSERVRVLPRVPAVQRVRRGVRGRGARVVRPGTRGHQSVPRSGRRRVDGEREHICGVAATRAGRAEYRESRRGGGHRRGRYGWDSSTRARAPASRCRASRARRAPGCG